MNKLILCEGESDAILLSYYLQRTCGWKNGNAPAGLNIKVQKDNQSAYWYKNGQDNLLICGVGGKDNFGNFFDERIYNPQVKTNAFQKIAIVVDRDDRDIISIQNSMRSKMKGLVPRFQNRQWLSSTYRDAFGQEKTIESLLLIIPTEREGALETLLLDAISSNSYDKFIVDSCKEFVDGIEPNARKYISSNRLRLKAYLSTTWAIQSPEKMFRFINEQINSVKWEAYDILNECFRELIMI